MVHPNQSLGSFIVDLSLRFSVSFLSSTMECDFLLENPKGYSNAGIRQGQEDLDCSAWRREGTEETLEPLPVLKEAPKFLERNFGKRPGETGQGEWLPTNTGQGFLLFPIAQPFPSHCCPCRISKGVWATSWVLLQEHPLGISSPQGLER